MQGVGQTDKWIVGAGVKDNDTKIFVYTRSGETKEFNEFQGEYGGFGEKDTGYLGHANDLCILGSNATTLWVGASHMYTNGIPIAKLDLSSATGTKAGHITLKASDGTSPDLLRVSSSQVLPNNKIIVSANGRYWTGTYNPSVLGSEQEVTITPISLNSPTLADYTSVVGELAPIVSTGQADWIDGDRIYKVRTSNNPDYGSHTISIIFEMKINSPTANPSMTGRYWAIYSETASNLEFEKCWVEDGKLKVSLNNVIGFTAANLTGTLGVL